MLKAGFDGERAEYEDENKNVVHAHGLLDDVAGKELQSFFGAVSLKNPEIENEGERHPEDAPDGGFAHGDFVRAAIEHAEIEHEQEKNSRVENNPEGWSAHRVSVVPASL